MVRAQVSIGIAAALGLLACAGAPDERARVVRDSAPGLWFYAQRASLGSVPSRARSRAVAQAVAEGLAAAPGTWVGEGPVNIGGRVTAIAVDPNDPLRIWVGSAAGGVFLTEDEGASFVPVFDDHPALSIGSLAAHPTDSQTLYVGTGEDNGGGYSYDGEGVFKTTDGGESWVPLGLAEVRRIGKVAVDPTDGDRVYVAAGGDWFGRDTHRGIYRSTDGGQSWQQVLFVGHDAGGTDLAIDPTDPSRIFASIWQRQSEATHWHIGGPLSGIYRSEDGGNSWVEMTVGLPTADMGRIGLAIAPSDPSVVYANIIGPDGRLQGIYRSTDGGDSWDQRNNNSAADWFGTFGYYFSQIRVDPADSSTTYSLDIRLLRSTNGGRSVTPTATLVHVDWHDLVIESSGRWLAATDGGFYVSHDDGSSWFHSEDLPITQLYDLGLDALDPQRRFGGSQDNGTLRNVNATVDGWHEVLADDGLQCEVDPTDSSKVYASRQSGLLNRSTDGGDSFTPATDGIDPAERRNWNTPLVIDPLVPSTLYTGGIRVYRSTDSMVTWTPISPNLTDGPESTDEDGGPPSGQQHMQSLIRRTITAIDVSPVDNGVLWAGTDDGNVWVTEDGGQSWTEVSPPGLSHWVTDIAADPFDSRAAYVTVTGYRTGDKLPYVRRTTDYGANWIDITANLPQVPVNGVRADTFWNGRLYVGTDIGVYLSDDGGASWADMRGGLPYVVVPDLVLHPSGTLWAATYGRSAYSYDLTQLGPADGDGDGVNNNDDCALGDPEAFAPPTEVASLGAARGAGNETLLTWSSLTARSGSGTRYDVARGDLSDFTAGAESLACGVPGTSLEDFYLPPAGTGVYYLVRGANACGMGPWGVDSEGSPRSGPSC